MRGYRRCKPTAPGVLRELPWFFIPARTPSCSGRSRQQAWPPGLRGETTAPRRRAQDVACATSICTLSLRRGATINRILTRRMFHCLPSLGRLGPPTPLGAVIPDESLPVSSPLCLSCDPPRHARLNRKQQEKMVASSLYRSIRHETRDTPPTTPATNDLARWHTSSWLSYIQTDRGVPLTW